MGKYTVEKGLPLSALNKTQIVRFHEMFPFDAMEVGDSFFVSPDDDSFEHIRGTNERDRLINIRGALYYHSKRYAQRVKSLNKERKQFATRIIDRGNIKGVRIWRTQ